jgi:tetratricopeptide (TPR) repeat protein
LPDDWPEARAAVENAATSAAGDASTTRVLASAWRQVGEPTRAVKVLDERPAGMAEDPEAAFLLGTEYLWLKQSASAERLFTRALAARPLPQLHVLIGRAYRDAGEYERARTHFRSALSQDPRVRHAHYYLGMTALADGAGGSDRLDVAIAEFRAELALAPTDPLSNDQLGVALLDAGRAEEAVRALEIAAQGDARFLAFPTWAAGSSPWTGPRRPRPRCVALSCSPVNRERARPTAHDPLPARARPAEAGGRAGGGGALRRSASGLGGGRRGGDSSREGGGERRRGDG